MRIESPPIASATPWQDDGMSAPLVLLDGASMWFRSFFGVPSSITAPDGRPVNAVRGFFDAVATVITQAAAGPTGGVPGPATGARSGASI